ncbi:GNAT family N-acetyltransferase [Pokkaliibacter sp. MBI-7]|uniref:GNAT family N-acetyltransferase n=1 Tax=Pokkaliibacter sp. MBI-7 TaxID=3040600 RepID=UPI002448C3ED|nr:GNAT family N-acetyltransferase [Pokkaliibacter sp. MBI-7]MDH2433441.1 GNAT family N-acetyltransferase [Pokkaliibacter sp. MBI-7]
MLQVELATAQDIPAMCALLTQLFSQEAEFQPDWQAQSRGLQRIIDDPGCGLILVLRQMQTAQVVGMVNLLFTVSTALGERVALLEDMIIDQHHRQSGAGAQLLQAGIERAREQGCRRITLLTDEDNLRAQQFYGRQGFTVSTMKPMRLML